MAAIQLLGESRDEKFTDTYLNNLYDESDRVTYAAAIALGKSRSTKAFEALLALRKKPSWKNQSLIACLQGLKWLGDSKGKAIALEALIDKDAEPRWTLAVPIWDFRVSAAETLAALKHTDAAQKIINERFYQSLQDNDINDIFNNALLAAYLGDTTGNVIFDQLKEKYSKDENIIQAVTALARRYESSKKSKQLK